MAVVVTVAMQVAGALTLHPSATMLAVEVTAMSDDGGGVGVAGGGDGGGYSRCNFLF